MSVKPMNWNRLWARYQVEPPRRYVGLGHLTLTPKEDLMPETKKTLRDQVADLRHELARAHTKLRDDLAVLEPLREQARKLDEQRRLASRDAGILNDAIFGLRVRIQRPGPFATMARWRWDRRRAAALKALRKFAQAHDGRSW